MPNPLAGKSLEDIMTGWQQELEKHSVAFVGQARLLAAWDSAVLSNRHALLDVEQELRAVHAGQDALERQLDMVETHQKEVHDSLLSVEAEAERLFTAERALMDGDTLDRDRLYSRAQAVSGSLSVLAMELTRSVDQVNDLAAASLGDPSTPMGSVVRVLNGQLQALGQLEGRIEELNGQLDALKVAAPGLAGGGGYGGMIRAA
eukprot:GHRQ01021608.1.p1 GENE.GHRQ01021608.1~~GHRQ01021608.1.p1  ORF type:complete len:218 (+),score=115.10 GHRQ01021608.1:43-654(+)